MLLADQIADKRAAISYQRAMYGKRYYEQSRNLLPIGNRERYVDQNWSSAQITVPIAWPFEIASERALSTLQYHWTDQEFVELCTSRNISESTLFSIFDNVVKFFPGASVKESVLFDPEDGCSRPVISIIVNSIVVTARKQLREFDTKWWLKQSSHIRRNITIRLDFL